jgi:hypothetical protein
MRYPTIFKEIFATLRMLVTKTILKKQKHISSIPSLYPPHTLHIPSLYPHYTLHIPSLYPHYTLHMLTYIRTIPLYSLRNLYLNYIQALHSMI